MFKTIVFFADFTFSLIGTIPSLVKVNGMKKKCTPQEVFDRSNEIATKWAKNRLKCTGATVHLKGAENIPKDRTVLFVSNHQSNVDLAVFLALIEKNKGYVAKVELAKIPLLSHWMRNINCVFMDRSDAKKSGKAIVDAIKLLKSGFSMVIFPEGTRSRSSTLSPFKSGSIKVAVKAKVPIVPVTLDGTYKVMEEHNRVRAADIYVTVHELIETENVGNSDIEDLSNKITETIKSALHYV